MLKLIIRQANWGILGSLFRYAIIFFVSVYVVREVGKIEYGKYATAHVFATIMDVFLAIGIPYVILRFFPSLLKKDPQKASFIIRKMLRYAVSISLIFMIVMFLTKDLLDIYIYPKTPNFSYLLFIISVHAPISIFMGIITSLYRSVLKIKEIMLYGTFISVPLRGVITFIVFQYTSDIFYLVAIDIFVQLLTLFLMYYFFNKREFKIFNNNKLFNNVSSIDNNIFSYGKKMYANSILSLFSNQGLPLLIGVLLLPEEMGIYRILMQIAALSMFLNKNLRNIFSPAISKLYEENKISELNILYKQTTFIVNILTIPFCILMIFFANVFLRLYDFSTEEILLYKPFLIILIIARMIYLIAGSSGAFMIMAGIEKKEILIQTIRGVLSILIALIFIEEYKLGAVVILIIFSMIFVAIAQLISIKKEINISPFSSELFLLILLSIPIVFCAINYQITFSFYHYILLPIILYLFYFAVFYKRLKTIYLEIK
jgi:O-antigen/teichoic acid export membrane protein